MNRASPADLRKQIEAANLYTKAGILFVPMPVLNPDDYQALIQQADQRLGQLCEEPES
ncbi:MAG: DUF1382 family protein [Pseudomonas sp.]|nr:DUF1382 family protein [Pseudomonas sp.]